MSEDLKWTKFNDQVTGHGVLKTRVSETLIFVWNQLFLYNDLLDITL